MVTGTVNVGIRTENENRFFLRYRQALNYSLNQETYLRTFLENGEVLLDNNDVERSIKKFCVGNKNWQIAATKDGAEASGPLYSIAETAMRTEYALPFQACAGNNDSVHGR